MKKISLFILLSFFNFGLLFSQNEEESQPKLPQVIPVSPEAASLGKYGDLPVNLSTGKINYTIPIYTIKVGDFELPLTLSYSYGGFMPEEEPSMVGMGWTANFGGAIIRQLKGKPDEKGTLGYLNLSNYYENFLTLSQEDQELTIVNAGKGFWDSRPDGFIINTPLMDGTFRFKNSNTPIFTPFRNHKVSVLNYTTPGFNGFDISDEKGVIYTFDAFEQTEQESLNGDADILEYRSSWMISKIDLPDSSDEISFSYNDYYHTVTSLSKYRTKKVSLTQGPPCGECVNSSVFQSESETRINAKSLDRIDFPNGYILFNHDIIQNVPGAGISQKDVLRSISIFDLNDKLIEKYNLGYYELQDYHFLTSIQKESDDGAFLDYYSFDYHKLNEVPGEKILNDKSDIWGFYNDISFDPDNITSQNANFDKGVIGALKKITYPTKGHSEIEYESNSILRNGDLYDNCNPIYNVSEVISIDSGDYPESNFCPDVESPIEKLITIPFTQVVNIELTAATADAGVAYAAIIKEGSLPPPDPFFSYSCSTVEGFPFSNVISALVFAEDNPPEDQIRDDINKDVNLGPGIYKLYVEVCGNGGQSTIARARISYRTEAYQVEDQNIDIGGIRVTQTKDCPDENNQCVTKNYNYLKDDGVASSGILLANPKFTTSVVTKASGVSGCRELTERFSSVIPLATYNGSHVLYNRVEIVNDLGDNGKTVNNYTGIADNSPSEYFPDLISIGRGIKRGKLEKQEIFEKTLDTFSIRSRTEHLYTNFRANDNSGYVFDFFSTKFFYNYSETEDLCIEAIGNPEALTYVSDYRAYYPDDYKIESTIKTTYLNGDEIKTQTENIYDDIIGVNKEIAITNSEGEIIKTQFNYPKDVTSISSLGTPHLSILQYDAIDRLKVHDLHKIGIPVLTKTFNNSEKTITQRTNYKNWGNNILLPEFIQVAKNNDSIEDRIQYHAYDDKGNPLEVSKTDGTHISYIWGYNQQYPVAKIENATRQEIHTATNLSLDFHSGSVGLNSTEENTLRVKLPDAMITTYTYDPLIGVTSITDPRGYTTYYEYDKFNRLEFVKDVDGNILSKNVYNYRN